MAPKKGGFTVIRNNKNELIPTRTMTGWRVCIDYRKLNTAKRNYHFPLPFIDQMLDRLARHPHFCFLDHASLVQWQHLFFKWLSPPMIPIIIPAFTPLMLLLEP